MNPQILTRFSTWPLCQFAYSAKRCGGRIRTGVKRLMRPCWNHTPVHPAVTKGRVELPMPKRLDVLSVVCLPVAPLGQDSVARVGIEPTNNRQGLSLVALPVCVPCQAASPMGFEPTSSTLTGWRALQAAPRGQTFVARVGFEPTASFGLSKGGLPVAYRADLFQFRRLESNQRQRVQSPMSYRLDDP